jgi:DNA-binding GntR family transcriptional regulator
MSELLASDDGPIAGPGEGTASAVVAVAARLRQAIIEGEYPPNTPLREVRLAQAMNVSRNTLRESLRMLTAEQLVEQIPNRGSVVATPSIPQIVDIYRVRRVLEVTAVEQSAHASDEQLARLENRVAQVAAAAARRTWNEVGTASLKFHQELVALLGSAILDDVFATLAARLRLVFLCFPENETWEERWVARDQRICSLIVTGRRDDAAALLRDYLDESERAVLDLARQLASARSDRDTPKPPTRRRTAR